MSKRELPVIQAKRKKPSYDCSVCPSHCCTYEWIKVGRQDIRRLAGRFKLTFLQAKERFTKLAPGYGLVLRHRKDHIYGTSCRFLDGETRLCTVYEHRPDTCREYPEEKTCGYYDYMMWERKHQDDPEYVPLAAVR